MTRRIGRGLGRCGGMRLSHLIAAIGSMPARAGEGSIRCRRSAGRASVPTTWPRFRRRCARIVGRSAATFAATDPSDQDLWWNRVHAAPPDTLTMRISLTPMSGSDDQTLSIGWKTLRDTGYHWPPRWQ